jgi:hypothetical protein
VRELRLELDGVIVARFELGDTDRVLKVGSGADADIRVDDPRVPAIVGDAIWKNGRLVFVAKGGVARPLRDGDFVVVGRYRLVAALSGGSSERLRPFDAAETLEASPIIGVGAGGARRDDEGGGFHGAETIAELPKIEPAARRSGPSAALKLATESETFELPKPTAADLRGPTGEPGPIALKPAPGTTVPEAGVDSFADTFELPRPVIDKRKLDSGFLSTPFDQAETGRRFRAPDDLLAAAAPAPSSASGEIIFVDDGAAPPTPESDTIRVPRPDRRPADVEATLKTDTMPGLTREEAIRRAREELKERSQRGPGPASGARPVMPPGAQVPAAPDAPTPPQTLRPAALTVSPPRGLPPVPRPPAMPPPPPPPPPGLRAPRGTGGGSGEETLRVSPAAATPGPTANIVRVGPRPVAIGEETVRVAPLKPPAEGQKKRAPSLDDEETSKTSPVPIGPDEETLRPPSGRFSGALATPASAAAAPSQSFGRPAPASAREGAAAAPGAPAPQRAEPLPPAPVASLPKRSGAGGVGALGGALGRLLGRDQDRVDAPVAFGDVNEDPTLTGGPTEVEVEVEVELRRRTTVRYYTQMNPARLFPLLVCLSKETIKKVVLQGVAQVESKQTFAIKKENPVVTIEPHLPGCLVTPAAVDVDVTPRLVETRFTVAPLVEGTIDDARIDIRYLGRVIDSVPLSIRVTKQTVAKVSAAFGLASPVFSQIAKAIGKGDLGFLDWIRKLSETAGGPTNLGWIAAGTCAVLAGVFYLWNRPKEATPVDHFFDFEVPPPTGADPLVVAMKARLLVLGDSDRRVISLEKPVTAIGGDPGSDVFLRDGSVAWKHADVRFDGTSFRLVNLTGAEGRCRVEDRSIPDETVLKEDQMVWIGGVLAFFTYERSDESLDPPGERAQLARVLSDIMPPAADAVAAALRDPSRPVRAGVIALLASGAIGADHWQRTLRTRREETSRRTVLS